MEIDFCSPPLFNDGRPVLTVITTSETLYEDFPDADTSQFRFFRGDIDVTSEVARVNSLSLTPSGTIEAPDYVDFIMVYAEHALANPLGFDLMIGTAAGMQVHIVRSHSTAQ